MRRTPVPALPYGSLPYRRHPDRAPALRQDSPRSGKATRARVRAAYTWVGCGARRLVQPAADREGGQAAHQTPSLLTRAAGPALCGLGLPPAGIAVAQAAAAAPGGPWPSRLSVRTDQPSALTSAVAGLSMMIEGDTAGSLNRPIQRQAGAAWPLQPRLIPFQDIRPGRPAACPVPPAPHRCRPAHPAWSFPARSRAAGSRCPSARTSRNSS